MNNSLLDPEKNRYSLVANEEGLIAAKLDSVETRLAWSAITDFYQTRAITILYLSPDNYFYFPTKAMILEQHAELDELVAQHMTKRKP
jgi:hypothetical protein